MFVESPVVDILLKVTLVLAVAPIAARALSRGSAAARHQIWVVALAASLLMPVLAAVAPRWSIAVLPAPPAEVAPLSTAAAIKSATVDPVFEPIPALTPDVNPEPLRQAASANPLSTATTIWLVGVLLVLTRLAFGTARVWWIARRATPAPIWMPLGHHLARSLGIDRHVTFLAGDEDAMPMAWGLMRAHVLLPAEAEDWPLDRQRVVLLHELAHVKRRDCVTQMLAHVACAAYWFNPLVWLAAQRLRAERERACDDSRPCRRHAWFRLRRPPARHRPLAAQRGLANLVRRNDGAPFTTRGKTYGDSRSCSAPPFTHSPRHGGVCHSGHGDDRVARRRAGSRESGRGGRAGPSLGTSRSGADACTNADAYSPHRHRRRVRRGLW